uniref:Uncharacterized protein n=1 Tax=Chromera velia CCMP2878 TaxID=1169474 RepID=A0A0G4FN94_9ALVE|eukprot:Cvel_17889.t1-p1 / transcript=Cvel_17889.t1 / gene=Cvel_17889 / organism=Chromera_velia_CCMP2878 / gene_product=hypothetical protein / transcript_product=hypothetical protein / location=Cvel_scaffold1452:301-6460(-) / protein_length=1510 / sequence_SO=supercontig / SO=protein_coding / is_pseudo=false
MEASVRGLSSVDSHPYQASFSDAPGRYGTQKISGLSCEGHGLTLHERDRPGPIHKAFSHAGPVRPLHPSADVKEEREGRKAKAKEELRDLLRGRRQNLREKKSGMKGQNDVTTSECALPGYSSVPAVHSRSLSCLSFPVRGEEEADPHTHEPRPPPLPPTGERPKRGPSSTEYRREIFSHDPSASHKQRRTEVGQEEKHPDRNPLEHSAFSQTSSSSALRDLLRERPRSRRGARRGEGDGTSKRHTPASPLSLSSAGPPASPSPSVRVSLLGVRTPVSTPLTCPADGGPVSLPLAGGDGAQVRQGGAGGERGNGGWRDRGSELRGSVQEIWGTSDDDSDSTGFAESVETELIRILAGRGGKEKRKDQMGSSSQNNVKARKRNGGMWAEGGRAPIHGDLVSVRSTAAEPLPPHGSSSASARPCGETAECPVESGWATPVIESPSLPSRRAGRPTDRQGNANEAQRRGGVQPSTEEGKVKETGREDPLLSLLRMFPSKTSLRQLAETRCLPVPPLPPPPQPVSFEEKPSPERKGGATEVPSQASLSIPTPPDPFVSPLTLSFKRETPPFVSPSLPTAPLVKHETDIPQESAREGDLEKDFPQTARREHQRDMPDASSASSVRRGIQTAVASSRHSPLGRVRTEQESPEGGADTETHLKRRELQNTPPALPCPSSSRLKQRPTSPSPVRASPHPSSPIQERAHSPLTARQKPLQTVSMSREVKEDGGDKEEGREGDPPTVIRTKGDVYRSRVNGELRQQGGVRLQFSTSASPRSLEAQEEKGGNEPPGVPLVPTSPSHISLTVEERGTEQSRNLRVENREEGGEGEERGGEIRVVQEEAKEKRSFEQSSFFPKRNEEEGEKVSEADAEVIICSPGCVAPRQAVCSPTAASSVPASREVGMDSENGEPFRPPSSQRPLNAWGEEGGGSFERKKGVTAGSTKFDREEGQRILEDERGRNVRMRLVETERQRQVVKGEDSDSPSSPFSVPSLSCLWSLSINRNQKEKVPRETTRLSRGKGGGSAGWRETVAKCTASLGHREALHNKAERSRESLEPLRSSRSQGRGVDEGRGGFGFAGDADETETVSFVASAAPQTPSIARASRFLELPDCEEEEEDLEAAIMRMHSPPRPPSLREVRTEHHERGRGGGRGTLPSVREGGEQEGPQYVQEGEGEETEQGLGLDECGGHADYSESEGEEEERELDPRLAALGVCEEDVRDVHASWSALFRSLKALAAGGGDKTLPPSEEVRLTVGSPASQTHFGISVGSEDTKTAPLTSEDAPFLFTADGEGEGENPHCLRETDTAREKLQREEEEMVCDEKPQAVKTKKKKRALSEIKTLLTSFLSHVCSVQQNIILARVEREKEREREDERQREKKEGWGPPGRSRMAQQTAAGEGVGGLRESMALARSADNQELLESLWSRVAALESEVQKREEEERRLCVQLSSAKRALGVREREEAELEHMLRETEKRLETEAMENKRLRLEMRGGWGDRGDGAEGEREWTEGEEERRLECK